jgi:hypothetical protein
LLIPVVLLLLPVVLTLCFGWAALHSQEAEQKKVWAAFWSFGHLILISTLVGWWVTWDLDGRSALISKVFSGWLDRSSAEPLLFWALPTVSLGVFLVLCRTIDQSIFSAASIGFTGDSEAAITSLVSISKAGELPATSARLVRYS